jgi:hypothetical protein
MQKIALNYGRDAEGRIRRVYTLAFWTLYAERIYREFPRKQRRRIGLRTIRGEMSLYGFKPDFPPDVAHAATR